MEKEKANSGPNSGISKAGCSVQHAYVLCTCRVASENTIWGHGTMAPLTYFDYTRFHDICSSYSVTYNPQKNSGNNQNKRETDSERKQISFLSNLHAIFGNLLVDGGRDGQQDARVPGSRGRQQQQRCRHRSNAAQPDPQVPDPHHATSDSEQASRWLLHHDLRHEVLHQCIVLVGRRWPS